MSLKTKSLHIHTKHFCMCTFRQCNSNKADTVLLMQRGSRNNRRLLLLYKRACLNHQLLHNQRNPFISEKLGNFKAILRGHTQCASMYSFSECWLKRLWGKILLLFSIGASLNKNIYCTDTLRHKLNFFSDFSLNEYRILFTNIN